MSNKSSKSFTGEDREQQDPHQRKPEEQGKQAQAETPKSSIGSQKAPKQENLANRGYDEDQPRNPVRSTGSTKKHQESLPTGEPEPGDY